MQAFSTETVDFHAELSRVWSRMLADRNLQEGPCHSASACLRSSCSKALDMRLISADRASTILAVSRHVAVTAATSLMTVRD